MSGETVLFILAAIAFLAGAGFFVLQFAEWLKVKNRAAINTWRQLASQGSEAVPDFIAPGENAEVVVLDPKLADNNYPLNAACIGCKYRGRYLLPTKGQHHV